MDIKGENQQAHHIPLLQTHIRYATALQGY